MFRKMLRLIWTDVGDSLPTADENHRGDLALKRASATEDEVYIGLRDSSDAAQWRQLLTKTLGDTLYADIASEHDAVTVLDSTSIDFTLAGQQVTGTVKYAGTGAAATAARSDHNHDSNYAALAHGHAISDVTGLQTALDGKLGTGPDFRDVFPLNDVIATGSFNFRLTPTTSGTIIASATTGTALHDTGERHTADTFTWAYIWLDNVGWGWIVETSIA